MKIRAALLVVTLVFDGGLAAQTVPRAPQSESYSAGVTAILVDVVVRDKRGHPVADLTADDFEIYENETLQRLGSFSVVERGGGIGIKVGRRVSAPPATPRTSTTDAAAIPPATATDVPTVALVFDALRPEPLALAQKAALAYLPMRGAAEGRIGVFASDPGLRVLQGYTDDLSRVRRAVYSVSATGTAKQEAEAERRHALNERLVTLDSLGIGRDSQPFSPDGGNPTAAQALVEQQMTELEMRMLRTFESLDRDQRGFGTSDALLAVIESLAVMPGRKTLVYLSEGLPASPAMQARLDALVSVANRANVSVYAIDAAGLRAESVLAETRREMDAAAQERLRQNSVSRDPSNGPLMRLVERTEDLIRLDPHGGLARLAEDTGGFLIRDTNDMSSAFRRIDEDNRFHYLLTYSPANTDFDGKFRTIQVKVKRPGAQVFARKGYLAVRRAAPGLHYEAAALATLDGRSPPNAFPLSATGFVFPVPKGPATVPIVAQVKTRDLQFQVDEKRNTYAAQAVIVARIKDAAGQSVRTLSQQYILTGAATDVDAARGGEILFYRQPELAPGIYGLEVIVHDTMADRASARLSTLTVPESSGGRNLASTLVVVRAIEKVPTADRTAGLPFYYGDMLLYPNAGEPLRKGSDVELIFYVAFHASQGDPPAATLDILHSGAVVASVPVDLPRPALGERVQHVGKLPIDKFPAGTYQLRFRLRTAGEEQLRTAFFTIAQ